MVPCVRIQYRCLRLPTLVSVTDVSYIFLTNIGEFIFEDFNLKLINKIIFVKTLVSLVKITYVSSLKAKPKYSFSLRLKWEATRSSSSPA